MKATRRNKSERGAASALIVRARHLIFTTKPARLLAAGYLSYMIFGWLLLSLPFAQVSPQSPLDTLFTAVSAVSTTGLSTIDTASNFTLFGEIVVLALIQLGGLGYMTASSFAFLALRQRLSGGRQHAVRSVFGLPTHVSPARFVRSVVIFTLVCEMVGALILWIALARQGIDGAFWLGLFHSISAFCTAGFSLFSTSLEAFRPDGLVTGTIAILALLGALGFIVVVDVVQWFRSEPSLMGFSSSVILRFTLVLVLGTMLILGFSEPAISDLPQQEVWVAAFFQGITASTTVGFNSVPISEVTTLTALFLIVVMVIGASPAGTGGGLKTTTFAVLWAQMISAARGRPQTILLGRTVPEARVRLASASLSLYLVLLLLAVILLLIYEPQASPLHLVFECVSALSTVGLSMGITGDLSPIGKCTVIVLMYAGRVGILTFAVALAARDDHPKAEESDIVL